MSISYRKRGKSWYARGTVRVGREVITVKEFNTGCSSRADAEAIGSAEESRIRSDAINGTKVAHQSLTIADLFSDYMDAKRPRRYLVRSLMDLTKVIGHYPATQADEAWRAWVSIRGAGLSATTLFTWRSRYRAAVNYGSESRGLPTPKIMSIKKPNEHPVIYLSKQDQERLIAAYADYARPIALTLCFQGLRSGEAVRLDWRYVDLERRSLFIHRSKTGRQRSVPLHPRVYKALSELWERRGRPSSGIVFLNYFGKPYVDRSEGAGGGNALLRPHNVACKKAGITGFTPHGWRHHWASWMVMSGADLFTLMRLGGWSSLSMVQRYAAVSAEHMQDAISRLS